MPAMPATWPPSTSSMWMHRAGNCIPATGVTINGYPGAYVTVLWCSWNGCRSLLGFTTALMSKDTKLSSMRDDFRDRLGLYLLLLAVLSIPSFVYMTADPFAYGSDVSQQFIVSYVTALVPVGVIFLVPALRAATRSAFSPLTWPTPPMPELKAAGVIGLCLIIDKVFSLLVVAPLAEVVPGSGYIYLRPDHKLLAWFDLTLGMALSAISEELVNRVFVRRLIEVFTSSPFIVIILSSALFAAYHSYQGIPGVVSAFGVGIILMWVYIRMGSIIPAILIHHSMIVWRLYPYYFPS